LLCPNRIPHKELSRLLPIAQKKINIYLDAVKGSLPFAKPRGLCVDRDGFCFYHCCENATGTVYTGEKVMYPSQQQMEAVAFALEVNLSILPLELTNLEAGPSIDSITQYPRAPRPDRPTVWLLNWSRDGLGEHFGSARGAPRTVLVRLHV
jgi:hypothetical protein